MLSHVGPGVVGGAAASDAPQLQRASNTSKWAVKGGMGDDLSSIVQAEVDYWDATD